MGLRIAITSIVRRLFGAEQGEKILPVGPQQLLKRVARPKPTREHSAQAHELFGVLGKRFEKTEQPVVHRPSFELHRYVPPAPISSPATSARPASPARIAPPHYTRCSDC